MFYRANSEAGARGQAPLENLNPDAGIVQNIRVVKTEAIIDPYVGGSSPTPYNPFRAYGPARPAGVNLAFTVRPFDQWAAYEMNGLHGVVTFFGGAPPDQVGTFGDGYGSPVTPFRAVARPVPQNWDAATMVGG